MAETLEPCHGQKPKVQGTPSSAGRFAGDRGGVGARAPVVPQCSSSKWAGEGLSLCCLCAVSNNQSAPLPVLHSQKQPGCVRGAGAAFRHTSSVLCSISQLHHRQHRLLAQDSELP